MAESGGVHIIKASRQAILRSIGKYEAAVETVYETKWKPVAQDGGRSAQTGRRLSRRWIVFADTGEIGARLAEFLEMRGDQCVLVYPGNQFRSLHEGHYFINPRDPEDYRRLVAGVILEGMPCHGIVHLWSMNSTALEKTTGQALESEYIYSTGSVLFLVQQILGASLPDNPRLWLVTKGCQAVLDREVPVNAAQAPLWGLGRVIALEHGEIWGGLIDLDPLGADDVRNLMSEILDPSGEDLLAFRKRERFGARLVRVANENLSRVEVLPDPQATYLITGGSGGLGLPLAEWLVENGARSLALVSRKGAAGEPLEALKALGAEILTYSADVTDESRLREVLDDIRQGMPPLKGVFHLAGELGDGMIYQQSWDQFMRVMKPKVVGAWNLHMLTSDIPLDYFVLFSSVVSVLGAPGQSNYAAANAFMDSLGHYRRSQGLPALSVNWGPWDSPGMTSSLSSADISRWKERGFDLVARERGFGALKYLLGGISAQCGVFSVDWLRYVRNNPAGAGKKMIFELSREQEQSSGISQPVPVRAKGDVTEIPRRDGKEAPDLPQPSIIQELKKLPAEKQGGRLAEIIRGYVAEALWVQSPETIDMERNLVEIGLDSLMIIGLRSRLQKDLGVNIPLPEILRKPNIEGLAGLVLDRLGGAVEAAADPAQLPAVVIDKDKRYDPFPLTDVQYAYWVGRSGEFDLGDVSCHVYIEVEVNDLDIDRLNLAITRLVQRHEMLRSVVLPDGRQRINEKTDPYRVKVLDVRRMDPLEAENRLESLRESMSHAVHPSHTGPLFEVLASLIDDNKTRLHVSFDLLIGDGWTFNILLTDLYAFYRDPATELPALDLSFRDYLMAEQSLRGTVLYQKSLEYWRKRVADLPPAPDLPMVKHPGDLKRTRFSRLASRMEKEDWDILKKKAGRAGLTASGVLLAAFAEVLSRWSRNPRFTIMLTLFNRLPIHPQVNDIAGDFTSLITLVVDASEQRRFEEQARVIQEQLWEDMEHRYVSGVQVLRELGRVRGKDSVVDMPVVFTSVLPYSGASVEETSTLGLPYDLPVDFVYCISQTPQVWLDFQIFDQNGGLIFNWDVVEELFPEGLLQDMFTSLCLLLKELVRSDEVWREFSPAVMPLKQIRRREDVNGTGAPVSDEMLHTLFMDQARQQPGREAVVTSGSRLTYADLNARANQVGRLLRDGGARPNRLVWVIME